MHSARNSNPHSNKNTFRISSTPSNNKNSPINYTPDRRHCFLQRNSPVRSSLTSPSRSDSTSLSKFYVKNLQKDVNDPQRLNKIFDKIYVLRNQSSVEKLQAKNLGYKKSKAPVPPSVNNLIKTNKVHSIQNDVNQARLQQEGMQYKELYQKRVKQFKQSTKQLTSIKLRNKVLEENNRKLTQNIQQLQQRVQNLESQQLKSSSTPSQRSSEQTSESHHKNPLTRLKTSRFLLKSHNPLQNTHPQSIQCPSTSIYLENKALRQQLIAQSEKHYLIQEQLKANLFQSRQQVKRLSLQIDCLKMKSFKDLQLERKRRTSQYNNLKKRFNEMLNQYTEIRKTVRKEEISNLIKCKIKGADNIKDSLIEKSSGMKHSDSRNSILEISISSQGDKQQITEQISTDQ